MKTASRKTAVQPVSYPHAEIVDGVLVFRIPINSELRPSNSGKTLLVATTGKAVSTPGCEINGQSVFVSMSAYIYPPR